VSPFHGGFDIKRIVESDGSNVEKKDQVVSDAPVQAESVIFKKQSRSLGSSTLSHYHQTRYHESDAHLPTTLNLLLRLLAVDWILISGALSSRRFADTNLLCGMPSSPSVLYLSVPRVAPIFLFNAREITQIWIKIIKMSWLGIRDPCRLFVGVLSLAA
jgi:hypothetical protein